MLCFRRAAGIAGVALLLLGAQVSALTHCARDDGIRADLASLWAARAALPGHDQLRNPLPVLIRSVLLQKLVHYAYQAGECDAQMVTTP